VLPASLDHRPKQGGEDSGEQEREQDEDGQANSMAAMH
jgi:hypothetical protein